MLTLEELIHHRFESIGILEGRTYHGDEDDESGIIFLRIPNPSTFNLSSIDVYLIVHPCSFLFDPELEFFNGEKMRLVSYTEWSLVQSLLIYIEDSYGKPVPDIFHRLVSHYKMESELMQANKIKFKI